MRGVISTIKWSITKSLRAININNWISTARKALNRSRWSISHCDNGYRAICIIGKIPSTRRKVRGSRGTLEIESVGCRWIVFLGPIKGILCMCILISWSVSTYVCVKKKEICSIATLDTGSLFFSRVYSWSISHTAF